MPTSISSGAFSGILVGVVVGTLAVLRAYQLRASSGTVLGQPEWKAYLAFALFFYLAAVFVALK